MFGAVWRSTALPLLSLAPIFTAILRVLLCPLLAHNCTQLHFNFSESHPNLPILASTIVSSHPASAFLPDPLRRSHDDEEFINRSLLDSLDEQADAEPLSSSDSEAHAPASLASSSGSVHYHLSNPLRPRPDSPSAAFNQAAMYSSVDFAHDLDGLKGAKLRELVPPGPYRTSTAFNAAFSSNSRPRQPTISSASGGAPFLRDTSNFSQHYPIDAYGNTQPISSPSSQPPSTSTSFDSMHQSRSAFDYPAVSQQPIGPALGGAAKPVFNTDVFATGNGNTSLLPPHKPNGILSGPGAQQALGTSQPNGFPGGVQPYLNGGGHHHQAMQSQTPYGPHLPSGGSKVPQAGQTAAVQIPGTQSAPQEEISTIFVVGFPDDMQEREFQNMFTFSPGFEAATLKIPNKDMSSYGQNMPPSGFRQGMYPHAHGGPNDPYNLVTINQGGVVVDNGRDGTTSSWQPNDELHFSHMGNTPNNSANNRKQIIGFAKFRTRAEALEARDTLQGRRVDIEKGAVLKAEMAKKNLHTKRGIGPLPLQLSSIIGSGGGPVPPEALAGLPGVNGIHGVGAPPGLGGAGGEVFSARDRELRKLGAMGVIGPRRDNRPDLHDDDLEVRKPSVIGSFPRGARERAEEERWKEKSDLVERGRLRPNDGHVYDAFHSVPATSRPTGDSLISVAVGEIGSAAPGGMPRGAAPPWGTVIGGREAQRKGTLPSGLPPRPPSASQQSPPKIEATAFVPGTTIDSFSPLVSGAALPQHPSLPLRPRQLSPSHGELSDMSVSASSGSSAISAEGDEDNVRHSLEALALSTVATPAAPSASPDAGTTSPQLPSPSSGTSSGSRTGSVDQNPPINTLYVGNLPSSPSPPGYSHNFLEESLRELFTHQPGFRKLCFRQKSNGPMCFVEFADVNFAKKALDELYGATLNGLVKGGGIRLSYSKNPLGVRTPTTNNVQQQPPAGLANSGSVFPADAFQLRGFGEGDPIYRPHRDSIASPTSFSYGMSSPPPRFVSPPPFAPTSAFHRSSSGMISPVGSSTFTPPSSFSPFGLQHPPSSSQQQTFSTFNQIPEHEQSTQPQSHTLSTSNLSPDILQQQSSPTPSPLPPSGV
ncbi:hypothetical protein K488DRAFT_82857 [Vararia minispora EC-137]|uniref:Uncharacterized protein n=1 Tax=Vararia minispora EC-137 TaxID=1314806 RepID=A0ACB8QVU1_9AGAM|nr:hypothetical protein K488DRAFT_82857 [Vararia minispora EC-137]